MRPLILVVDLASSDRTNWKSFLVNQGYEVIIAGDEDSAMRECHLLQPDLIILHDTLPEIDVLGLCRRLKESPRNELIPIVLIKAATETVDISRGRHAGAAEVWGTCTSLEEGLSRVQMLLRLNKYIDEQAKSVVLSLARSIEQGRGPGRTRITRIADGMFASRCGQGGGAG